MELFEGSEPFLLITDDYDESRFWNKVCTTYKNLEVIYADKAYEGVLVRWLMFMFLCKLIIVVTIFSRHFIVENNAVVGTVTGSDRDPNTTLQQWQIVGGTGAGKFSINPSTGENSEFAVAEFPEKPIQVYPNPTKGQVNINLGANTSNVRRIQVVDLSGRVVVQFLVGNVIKVVIPARTLKPGIYLIRFLGDKVISQKIVVQ